MESFQRKAIANFKVGRYNESLKFFDQAINKISEQESPNQYLSLLDQRAACHEKRQDWDNALMDGKKMIKLDPKNPKGYLRTGKVLQLKDNDGFAYKIYRKGLKNCANSGTSLYSLLESLAEKVKQKLSMADSNKSTDPLTTLPFELLHDIFSQFPFKSLVKCLCVSKNWYNFLSSDYALWKQLDFRQTKKSIANPKKVIKQYLKFTAENNLRMKQTLCFHNMQSTDENGLFVWLFQKQGLENFEAVDLTFKSIQFGSWIVSPSFTKADDFSNLHSLREISVNCKAYYEHAFILLTKLPLIESFKWKDTFSPLDPPISYNNASASDVNGYLSQAREFTNLQTLMIHSNRRAIVGPDFMGALLEKCPNVENFDINLDISPEWASWISLLNRSKLKKLKFINREMVRMRSLPFESLQCLQFYNIELNDGSELSLTPSHPLYHLTELDLTGLKFSVTGLSQFFQHTNSGPQLTCLILDYCRDNHILSTTEGYMNSIGKYCPKLEKLSFLGSSSVNDKTVEGIIKSDSGKFLQELDLTATSVTGVGMINLVKHGITSLGVEGCDISVDTYLWMKRQGVIKPVNSRILVT